MEPVDHDKHELGDMPEMPNGWEWRSAESGDRHYTRWFGTEYRGGGDLIGLDGSIGGFDGELYWDEGSSDGNYHVQVYPIMGVDGDDPVVSEYPSASAEAISRQAAHEAAVECIEGLKAKARDD
jgi:hypothetical protein